MAVVAWRRSEWRRIARFDGSLAVTKEPGIDAVRASSRRRHRHHQPTWLLTGRTVRETKVGNHDICQVMSRGGPQRLRAPPLQGAKPLAGRCVVGATM